MQRLHPLYKDVAKQIAEDAIIFYSDDELSRLLEEEKDTDQYRFEIMNLIGHLLDEYSVDFIRSENQKDGKGYKKATSAESVKITANRISRRIRNAARKQRKVLSIVITAELNDDTRREYDAHCIRSGLLRAFLAQTPLSKCLTGLTVRVDRPALKGDENA